MQPGIEAALLKSRAMDEHMDEVPEEALTDRDLFRVDEVDFKGSIQSTHVRGDQTIIGCWQLKHL